MMTQWVIHLHLLNGKWLLPSAISSLSAIIIFLGGLLWLKLGGRDIHEHLKILAGQRIECPGGSVS